MYFPKEDDMTIPLKRALDFLEFLDLLEESLPYYENKRNAIQHITFKNQSGETVIAYLTISVKYHEIHNINSIDLVIEHLNLLKL